MFPFAAISSTLSDLHPEQLKIDSPAVEGGRYRKTAGREGIPSKLAKIQNTYDKAIF